jgi:hypothetical protein
MMKALSKSIGQYFKAPASRPADPFRKSRPEAKKIATALGIEIEPMRPGFNVWPPAALADTDADEFGGDHFADALIAARAEIIRLHDKLRVRSKLLVDIFNSDEAMGLPESLKGRIEACTSGRG